MTSPATYQRGDRVALVRTDDPGTRLRPGDQGTVTQWDPAQGQIAEHRRSYGAADLVFCVKDMSVTLTSCQAGACR